VGAPLREGREEVWSGLAQELEVGSATNAIQLGVGQEPLHAADREKDAGEGKTREWPDYIGQPERQRQ
jgi:hypothetical protein